MIICRYFIDATLLVIDKVYFYIISKIWPNLLPSDEIFQTCIFKEVLYTEKYSKCCSQKDLQIIFKLF